MTKYTQMSIVRRNNNMSMMLAPAAKLAGVKVGAMMMSPAGRELIWNGMNWIRSGVSQLRGKKKKGKVTDLITHPGANAGAVAAPVAVTRIVRASRPKFVRSKGAVTITHRELVGQFNNSPGLVVNGGVTGNVYRVNPSNAILFPWLQSLAVNFDQYKFDNVRVSFIPMCATTETGRVGIYFDKDSQDPEPLDRIELANMGHLTETAPWCEAQLNIPVDNVKRFMNDNTTTDPKLVDLGQIGIATYGGSGTNPVGDLFVHYTVTFFEPQPSATVIETEQTGTGAITTGPDFVSVATGSTFTTLTFRTPGTFLVVLAQRNTTLVGVTPISVTVNSNTSAQATGFFISTFNVTVPAPGGQAQWVGTGLGNYTLTVVRARAANVLTLI